MRGLLAMLLLLTAVTALARADTTWVEPGSVSGLWSALGSPYIVHGDIAVETGDSLVIGPGVRIYFDGPYAFEVDSGAFFNALGSEGDSIVFTTDTLVHPERWAGFALYAAADTVRLAYCVVENSGFNDSENVASRCRLDLSHSAFRHCRGGVDGGAFGLWETDSKWTDCSFEHCAAGALGGALYLYIGRIEISRCRFTGNRAVDGGALYLFASDPGDSATVEDCYFEANSAEGSGYSPGGAVFVQFTATTLRRCVFRHNTAGDGGAVESWNNSGPYGQRLRFEDCRFENNTARAEGGAVRSGFMLQAVRCVFLNNQATDGGAVFSAMGSDGESYIDHCTFTGNSASQYGAAVSFRNTSFGRIRNSIIAFCNGSEAVAIPEGSCTTWEVRHSDFFANPEGNFDASPLPDGLEVIDRTNSNGDSCDAFGNLYLDPLFVDREQSNVHVTAASPCIDAADPAAPRDPDSTISDMGAFHTHRDPAAVESKESFHPQRHALQAPYPNPFNATTVIPFDVAVAGTVSLKIVDLLGREVAVLVNQPLTPGAHRAVWTAHGTPSGLYLAVLESGTSRLVRKLMLVK